MPTRNPRINLVIEKPLFSTIKTLAEKNHLSLSSQVKKLVNDALETFEDVGLTRIADERSRSFSYNKALSHESFWKEVKKNLRS